MSKQCGSSWKHAYDAMHFKRSFFEVLCDLNADIL